MKKIIKFYYKKILKKLIENYFFERNIFKKNIWSNSKIRK